MTKHLYEVTENTTGGNVKVGGFMVADKHVRKHHEPERRWDYLDMNTGKPTHILARHIGEYEKVLPFVQARREQRVLMAVLEAAEELVPYDPDADDDLDVVEGRREAWEALEQAIADARRQT